MRTDVYSLGVILYEILSGGRFPYPIKGSYRDVLNNIVSSPPIPLSDLDSDDGQRASKRMATLQALGPLPINPIIEAIVMKCLDKQQKNRYGSAAELGQDIANYLAGKPTIAQPSLTDPAAQTARHARPVKSRSRPFSGRAAFFTALGVVGAAFYLHDRAPAPIIEQKQNPAPPIEQKTAPPIEQKTASPIEEQNAAPLVEKENPTQVSTPPDEQRILGKWKKNQSFMGMNTLFIEFCEDGTMRDGTTARTLQGKYRLLPDHKIEMDQEGLLGKWSARTKTVARYELTDNELLIMPLHGNDRYIRCERVE